MPVIFGVGIEGLPRLPFSLPTAATPVGVMRWTEQDGRVAGPKFWKRDFGNHISVGWSSYASYDVHLGRTPAEVLATCQVDRTEAAVAFVLSVLPLVLPVWDIEPFHGSAVLTSRGALLILGPSGSGKSSLAAEFEHRGYPLLADDTCALQRDLRLWPGPAAVNPRWSGAEQPSVREYNGKSIRTPSSHAPTPASAAAVVVLKPQQDDPEIRVEEVPSVADRMSGLLSNTRHGTFLGSTRQALQFSVAADLARLPSVSIAFDPAAHDPRGIVDRVEGWLAARDVSRAGATARSGEPANLTS
jgi:hypothetical protein